MAGEGKTVYFVINLLQDVNIVRGLVYLTARETDAGIGFLVSRAFMVRDSQKIWNKELSLLASDVGASVHLFETAGEAFAVLQGGAGIIFAASESNLSAHRETTEVFRIAPAGYLRITLQHGFECVGFLQSREHVMGHGRNISFASDVICGWFEPAALTSLTVSERSKLYVSGPPTLLQQSRPGVDHPPIDGGIVCENLHSVRLRASGDHKASFMEIFFAFCAKMAERDVNVTMRPHPGGQYVLKNKVELPDNVRLNNLPIFHVDLKSYAYGISAPSTIVFDMVLAGIPVGVWRDPGGVMDAGNYDGLTEISTLDDWLAFERDVRLRPAMILQRQAAFLERLQMPTDPAEIYRRFARLIVGGLANTASRPPQPVVPATRLAARRILFVANGMIPTLQLSFLKPLEPLFADGTLSYRVLTGEDLIHHFGQEWSSDAARKWTVSQVSEFHPDLIVCCRYSSPNSDTIIEWSKANNVPVIYHVDDDLLNIPPEIGDAKYRSHNHPMRIDSVTTMLDGSDLRYYSTRQLKRRYRQLNHFKAAVSGNIYCASEILRVAERGKVNRIGYMGFDHAHDLEIALPGLSRYLRNNPDVSFELFGSIPIPDILREFGDRVELVPPVRDYHEFLRTLAGRAWDIGIAPLAKTPFNKVKANTKWVEYTACGMATIASRGLVYDECAANGRGVLVEEQEWEDQLQRLTDFVEARYQIAQRAQAHLVANYSSEQLREQILSVFAHAERLAGKDQGMPPALHRLRRPLIPSGDGLTERNGDGRTV